MTKQYQQQKRQVMVSLTFVTEGSVVAAEGPRPEEFVLEAWGLVRCILKKFLFLGPGSEVIKSNGAFGPLPRRSLLQSQQIAHFNRGRYTPTFNVIQGFQGTENPVPIGLQLKRSNLNIVQIVLEVLSEGKKSPCSQMFLAPRGVFEFFVPFWRMTSTFGGSGDLNNYLWRDL